MARVQGDCHRCGRTVRAEVAPNRRTADWRAANRVFTCDSCRNALRQQRTDAAHAWAVACGLPVLEGTDAQIEWAEVIRQEKLTVLLELAWVLDPDADEVRACYPFYFLTLPSRCWERIVLASDQLWHQAEAHWWIEHRSFEPVHLLRQVALEVLLPEQVEHLEVQAALEQAAVESSTVIPEGVTLQSPLIVQIEVDSQTIRTIIDDRIESFRSCVKRLGYTWDDGRRRWQRVIDERSAPLTERVVQLAAELLRAGFKVHLPDPTIRARAIAGDYRPEHTRWLGRMNTGKYEGWILVRWSRAEDHYKRAHKLPGARYDAEHHCVVVPAAAWEALRDFAQLYDFRATVPAEQMLQQAESADRCIRMAKLEARMSGKPTRKDGLVEILSAPVEVPDDLRD